MFLNIYNPYLSSIHELMTVYAGAKSAYYLSIISLTIHIVLSSFLSIIYLSIYLFIYLSINMLRTVYVGAKQAKSAIVSRLSNERAGTR